MSILDEAQQVVNAIPQTPREFLVAELGDDWKHAAINTYAVQQNTLYTGVLWTLCPDCGEMHLGVAVFVPVERGGFQMLRPVKREAAL